MLPFSPGYSPSGLRSLVFKCQGSPYSFSRSCYFRRDVPVLNVGVFFLLRFFLNVSLLLFLQLRGLLLVEQWSCCRCAGPGIVWEARLCVRQLRLWTTCIVSREMCQAFRHTYGWPSRRWPMQILAPHTVPLLTLREPWTEKSVRSLIIYIVKVLLSNCWRLSHAAPAQCTEAEIAGVIQVVNLSFWKEIPTFPSCHKQNSFILFF